MNTKVVKSFGLALIVAVGVLALLLATGTFSPQKAGAQTIPAANITVNPGTVAAATDTPLTVGFQVTAGAITSGQEITIEFPGFALPSTIETSSVSIRGGGAAGTPARIAVSGQVVTLEVGDDSGGVPMFIAGGTGADVAQVYITFTRAAGLATGGVAGVHNIKVNDVAAEDDFTITPSVTLSHEAGFNNTELEIAGASFPAGDVNIRVGPGDAGDTCPTTVPGSSGDGFTPTVTGGAFTETFEVGATRTAAQTAFAYGLNCIYVVHAGEDGTFNNADDPPAPGAQKFTLSAEVTPPEEPLVRGDEGVEITVEQADNILVTSVTVGGTAVPWAPESVDDATPNKAGGTIPDNGGTTEVLEADRTIADGTITLLINVKDVIAGSDKDLEVLGGSPVGTIGSAKVDVISLTLDLSPDTAVQSMTVTLSGTGFNGGTGVTSLMVGGELITGLDDVRSNTRGQFVIPFTVPDLEGGTEDGHTVALIGAGGRIGEGTLTVPKPTITIDPSESRIGTSVGVTGTGFPANDPILIYYDEQTAGSANSNNVGEWKGTFLVPVGANPGDNKSVHACRPDLGTGKMARCSDEDAVTHSVPGASAELSATEARSGDTITVTGVDYKPYNPVTITIGTAEAKGTVSPDGTFTVAIRLPLLAPGPQLMTVKVGDDTDTHFLTALAADAIVSNDPADVFADLIEEGVLESVWIFDNDDDKYQGFNPGATDTERALAETLGLLLTEVNSGDVGWINLNADATFQGTEYKEGWRLVGIN